MGAPHNPQRYSEEWKVEDLLFIDNEIDAVKDLVVVSGGWAWHWMTPVAHPEYKHAHDHKDADLFVSPEDVGELMEALEQRRFEKQWTRFDDHNADFHRYVKEDDLDEECRVDKRRKVILDLFTEEVPFVETASGIRVVEPKHLLSLYGVKHSSGECFSVQIAKELIANGQDPNGHPKMADYAAIMKSRQG